MVALGAGQASFFFAYFCTIALWVYSLILCHLRPKCSPRTHSDEEANDGKQHDASKDPLLVKAAAKPMHEDMLGSTALRCILGDANAVRESHDTLTAMMQFGTIIVWFFICDRTNLLPQSEKEYSRDLFLFLFLLLTSVAYGASRQTARAPVLLNRPQTEEWKGWMQVLFLLYHYFEAREAYNAIRIFIAGYVWMTGYGNFTYYYKTADFSIGRFAQMMWRLNFMVFFCCAALGNSYMLYYICPMHTIFTVLVYAALGIAPHLNKTTYGICLKFVGSFAVILVFWDLKPVFYGLWKPMDFLVGYTNPRNPGDDSLYEWFFRSSLDRYIWIYGMLCAYLHPHAAAALTWMDSQTPAKRHSLRALLLSAVAVVFYFYYQTVYILPKTEYNKVHPYTSWIPLTCWMIVRNVTPGMREVSLRLYGWLGCITLETYLGQFHVWLRSAIPNGQPKYLLCLVPGYPLVNFGVVSALYIFLSHRMFDLTNTLKNAFVPHDDNRKLLRNTIIMGLLGVAAYVPGYVLTQFADPNGNVPLSVAQIGAQALNMTSG